MGVLQSTTDQRMLPTFKRRKVLHEGVKNSERSVGEAAVLLGEVGTRARIIVPQCAGKSGQNGVLWASNSAYRLTFCGQIGAKRDRIGGLECNISSVIRLTSYLGMNLTRKRRPER